jgi:hypothetical protein
VPTRMYRRHIPGTVTVADDDAPKFTAWGWVPLPPGQDPPPLPNKHRHGFGYCPFGGDDA